jgi:hypothetical protein
MAVVSVQGPRRHQPDRVKVVSRACHVPGPPQAMDVQLLAPSDTPSQAGDFLNKQLSMTVGVEGSEDGLSMLSCARELRAPSLGIGRHGAASCSLGQSSWYSIHPRVS